MPHTKPKTHFATKYTGHPTNAGELTYGIYTAFKKFLDIKGKKYLTFCIIIGSAVCAILEFYRLHIAKYEDEKIKENGEA